jgi:hypothetical protein
VTVAETAFPQRLVIRAFGWRLTKAALSNADIVTVAMFSSVGQPITHAKNKQKLGTEKLGTVYN